ncbi:glycosyltransferase family 2 protein [Bacillus sp. D386]|uniref:glycosyltransferase family 2 protein n=1 Tax=Bacillus sp. D386 TaxID=2587155 RepID=UPI0015D639DB|nr:glycosyltransferase family 2 protein [Bacillus sp. D386]
MKVSIVIPSHNRYEQLKNTIEALRKQSYDNYEVMIVDDASDDRTSTIDLPNHFRMIRNNKKMGLAETRNKGIANTDGDLILFLDAEMLVYPDYIENHVKRHEKCKNLVLTGAMYYYFITQRAQKKIVDQNINFLSEEFQKLIRFKDYYYSNIIVPYGDELDKFLIPWVACMGGNLSVKRTLLDQAGWFDPKFIGYGWEDWELGYRLHQCGATFKVDRAVGTIHQEHEVNKKRLQESLLNYRYFMDKHPSIEVYVMSLELISEQVTIRDINQLLHKYDHLYNKDLRLAFYEIIKYNARYVTKEFQKPFISKNTINLNHLPEGILKEVYIMLLNKHV